MDEKSFHADTGVGRGISAVLAAADGLPGLDALSDEMACAVAASERGYFLPDEEELVRRRYHAYLAARAALLGLLDEMDGMEDGDAGGWERKLSVFATAFAAGCLVTRADRFLVDLAGERPVVWKKLDEADAGSGIPRKTFTTIYQSMSHPANLRRFLTAADFYFAHRTEILSLAGDPEMTRLVDLLVHEESRIERRRRDALRRLFSYRWFSFLRRNRSAWKNVMFGLFEASGRAVAELRQPGIKPANAPKRISGELRDAILPRLKPGDVFVTRHDDALSNLFLPGFWPHAALYLGPAGYLQQAGFELPSEVESRQWFLESKKDGVRVRAAEETLQVDAFVVLRPPLDEAAIGVAIERAMRHVGKPYDFLFDFRTADRLVCTEVIYRGFHGIEPVKFHLEEVGGRLCLPAEEFLTQALACGFTIVATGGLEGDQLLYKAEAETAFQASRPPN